MQEKQVQTGFNSMVNIAKLLGMIKGKPRLLQGKRAVRNADTSYEVQSPCTGLFVPAAGREKETSLTPDEHVEKGDLLGHVIDERTLDEVPVISPVNGYLWQLGTCHDNM
jgi:predicted deacylase